jgi:hypothetical protein
MKITSPGSAIANEAYDLILDASDEVPDRVPDSE